MIIAVKKKKVSGKVSSMTKGPINDKRPSQLSPFLIRRTATMIQMATPTNMPTSRKHRERQSCRGTETKAIRVSSEKHNVLHYTYPVKVYRRRKNLRIGKVLILLKE